jgi:hypothetical protein
MCCGRKKPQKRLRMTRSGIKKRVMSLPATPLPLYGEPTPDTKDNLPKKQEEK